MTDEKIEQLRQTLKATEQEEIFDLPPVADAAKDQAMAAFVMGQLGHKAEPEKSKKEAPVTPLFRRRRTMVYGGMLLAAGLCAVLLPRLYIGGSSDRISNYQASVQGDDSELGQEPGSPEPKHVKLDSSLVVTLRPERDMKVTPDARAYVLKAARLIPWNVAFSASAQGTLKTKQRVSDLPGMDVGEQSLLFVVGRVGRLPGESEIEKTLSGAAPLRGDDWLLIRSQVIVER